MLSSWDCFGRVVRVSHWQLSLELLGRTAEVFEHSGHIWPCCILGCARSMRIELNVSTSDWQQDSTSFLHLHALLYHCICTRVILSFHFGSQACLDGSKPRQSAAWWLCLPTAEGAAGRVRRELCFLDHFADEHDENGWRHRSKHYIFILFYFMSLVSQTTFSKTMTAHGLSCEFKVIWTGHELSTLVECSDMVLTLWFWGGSSECAEHDSIGWCGDSTKSAKCCDQCLWAIEPMARGQKWRKLVWMDFGKICKKNKKGIWVKRD